jgi:DNA-binding MarR family transcriptional regulator
VTDNAPPSLCTLLSAALVAFTIEFDNEFEHQMAAAPSHPWFRVSMVMWSNFMRFLDTDGLSVRELSACAGVTKATVHPSLAGMERWGYVVVSKPPDDARPKPPRADWIVRPSSAGAVAQQRWRPLAAAIEARWKVRFGDERIRNLRDALTAVVASLDTDMPHYLPVVGADMRTAIRARDRRDEDPFALDLAALLSQALLAFTIEYERDAILSLPMSANALRVLDDAGVRVRDLPRLTGVSKEAISMSTGLLARRGFALVEPDPNASRGKHVRLTAQGLRAQAAHEQSIAAIEAEWPAQFGADTVRDLRTVLEEVVVDARLDRSPLAAGLVPYPAGWRASVPAPEILPHYPMVLHRGGWPDGS